MVQAEAEEMKQDMAEAEARAKTGMLGCAEVGRYLC